MLDQRAQLLRAALGFAGLSHPPHDRTLWALRNWLNSWAGIGHVAVGMHRQGYDLQLTLSLAKTTSGSLGEDPFLAADGTPARD